jgi:hypothetical protein
VCVMYVLCPTRNSFIGHIFSFFFFFWMINAGIWLSGQSGGFNPGSILVRDGPYTIGYIPLALWVYNCVDIAIYVKVLIFLWLQYPFWVGVENSRIIITQC